MPRPPMSGVFSQLDASQGQRHLSRTLVLKSVEIIKTATDTGHDVVPVAEVSKNTHQFFVLRAHNLV